MKEIIVLVLFLLLFLMPARPVSAKEAKPISLSGNIFEEFCSDVCHPPATAKFEIQDKNHNIIFTGQTTAKELGVYTIPNLMPGETYFFAMNDTNYLKNLFTIIIPFADKYTGYSRDFLITPKRKGAEILFSVSPFKFRTSKLKDGYNYYAERIGELIKQNPKVDFIISCFPDDDKDEKANMKLTDERCNNLKNYFVALGVNPERLSLTPNPKTDIMNPPPFFKEAKGRRYNGSTYLIIK